MASYHNAEQRNRQNILQDIQQKQQLLQHGNIAGALGNMQGAQHNMMVNRAVKHDARMEGNPMLSLTTRRSALEYASTHSSGYFIASDSTYGNPILPVIPRPDDSWMELWHNNRSSLSVRWTRWEMLYLLFPTSAVIIHIWAEHYSSGRTAKWTA